LDNIEGSWPVTISAPVCAVIIFITLCALYTCRHRDREDSWSEVGFPVQCRWKWKWTDLWL